MQNFHLRLKKVKEDNHLSTADISRLLGIHPPTWCKYESGKSGMSLETLHKFCTIFEVSADWLLGLKGEDDG